MTGDREEKEDLIAAIGDGSDVDWSLALGETGSDEDRKDLEIVRRIHSMAAFNRRIQRSSAPPWLAEAPPGGGQPGDISRAWGPLQLIEPIGKGGSSEVWRAFEPRLQRQVAVKLLKAGLARTAEGRERLFEEGSHLARIHHPGVAAVYGIEEHEGRIGLWMELLEGDPLDRLVERRGPFSAGEAAAVGIDLCRALAAIHRTGVIHRDIKAANVIRAGGGRVVITDFGLGRRIMTPGDAGSRSVSGTPMYMAPEVLKGDPATPGSDLYALGILLYFLASGGYPYRARTYAELQAEIEAKAGRRLRDTRPDLPAPFIRVVERATAPDPGARFATAGEMEAALRATLEPGRADSPPAVSRRTRFSPRLMVAAVATLAVALAWLLIATRRPDRPAGAGGPYDVEATLLRRVEDRMVLLLPGDRVSPGDRIALDIKGSLPLHVYVLNEDEKGEAYLLFPQPVYDVRNPIPAESLNRLPGTVSGRPAAWTVTSAGGREHFLVVASPEPLSEIEANAAGLPAPRPGRPVEASPVRVTDQALQKLRGVGGYELLPDEESGDAHPLFERVRRLAGKESGVRGVWVRSISLENPGP